MSATAALQAARTAKAEGSPEVARDIYRNILQDYPDTPSAKTAQNELDAMNGTPGHSAQTGVNPVRLVGVDIPFWDLVVLLVKLALASIPAIIILGLMGAFLGVVAGLLGY